MGNIEQKDTESLMRAKQLEKVVYDLSRNGVLWENEQEFFIRKLCKGVSQALAVERVGISLFRQQFQSLKQINLYTNSSNQHSNGLNLKTINYPKYLSALQKTPHISAENAHLDARTSELSTSYLKPLKIAAKLDTCIFKTGTLCGVLSVEQTNSSRQWTNTEEKFLRSIADLIAQRLLYDDIKSKAHIYDDMHEFETALSNSKILCIITTDSNGIIQKINPAGLKLLEYSEADLIGFNFNNLVVTPAEFTDIDDSSLTGTFKNLRRLEPKTMHEIANTEADSNIINDNEYLLRTRNGKTIPVALSISNYKSSKGAVKGFICTATDISKHIGTRRALLEEEERYKHVFNGTSDAIFLTNHNTIVDCNDASLYLYQCKREDLINQKISILAPKLQHNGQITHEIELERITKALNGTAQRFEMQQKRFSGTLFDAEISITRVNSNGMPYLLTTIRDISKRKESERELEKSRLVVLEHNENLALINELSNTLHGSGSQEDIYTKTVAALGNTAKSPAVTVYTVEQAPERLDFKMHSNLDAVNLEKIKEIPLNSKFNGAALETGTPQYSSDILNEPRITALVKEVLIENNIKAIVSIPLTYKQQKIGVIIVSYSEVNPLSLENIQALFSISKTVSLALANSETRSVLDHIAHHDSLTGLTNRAYYHKQFKERILKGQYTSAVLFLLDLDRFKEINDTLGHFTGDKVLQIIGPRLKKLNNQHEFIVSRLGGDEFTILFYGVESRAESEQLGKQILTALRKPFIIDDLVLEIDTSVGIANYPQDGMDSHALLRSADVAMYMAKKVGGGYSFYDQDRDIHTPERLAMIAEMGSSIKSGQLFLHYQPKINIVSKEIIGFEALARWDHPRLGLLGPSMFVPLIEMSNSIDQLTEEVLHQALSQQMQWRKNGMNYSVAVNISARNLIDNSLVLLLEKLLKFYDTPKGMLELEITETALMHDAYRATDYLKQIADLGVLLSIDDFGTGYSSLSYLQKLPIHKLKLDREFIMGMLNNPQGTKIVETIISLANTLELGVIAEGVEDQETLDKLREMNCGHAQGFHICRPDTWENIEHWLKRNDSNYKISSDDSEIDFLIN